MNKKLYAFGAPIKDFLKLPDPFFSYWKSF